MKGRTVTSKKKCFCQWISMSILQWICSMLLFPQHQPYRVLMKHLCSSKCLFQTPGSNFTRHVSTCDFTLQLQSVPQKLQRLKLNCFFLGRCQGNANVELLIWSDKIILFFSCLFFNMISWATGNNYNDTQKNNASREFSGFMNVIEEGKRDHKIFT